MTMFDSVRSARVVLSVLILIVLVFVGCQRSGGSQGGDNANVQITLQPVAQEDALVVALADANGAPITDATVALEGNMNHAGMVPVLADAVADEADGSVDGRYRLPFTFTMLGDWIVTVTVTQADGSSFHRDLNVRVGEDGITGDAVTPIEGEAAPNGSVETAGERTIHVEKPMARPAPLAGGTGAVYLTIHNGGDALVTFTGADTSAAAAVEIHTMENDNGVMRMRQVTDGVELGPDEAVELTPGGMHLMLVNLAAPLAEGNTITVTLHFAGANNRIDDLTVDVPVVSMDALPAEGDSEGNMGSDMAHDH
jgi:copper(I)-binding protein